MRKWRGLCRWLGVCKIPRPHIEDHPVLQKIRATTAKAEAVESQAREIRETGIWPQDMIRGTYRAPKREPRRGHS